MLLLNSSERLMLQEQMVMYQNRGLLTIEDTKMILKITMTMKFIKLKPSSISCRLKLITLNVTLCLVNSELSSIKQKKKSKA